MEAQIVKKPAFTVVGLRIKTKPKSPEIPKLWDAFVARINEIQNASEASVSYGVMASTSDGLDYMAGNPVTGASEVPTDMSYWDITENTYAVFEASIPSIAEVFDYVYQTWLPTSGFRHADSPVLERYGENFSSENPVLSIYIPLKPKA